NRKLNIRSRMDISCGIAWFLICVIMLLVFSSGWHLNSPNNFYHGPRWMGIWYNPNIYGMLMGTGLILVVGMLIAVRKRRSGEVISKSPKPNVNNQKSTGNL